MRWVEYFQNLAHQVKLKSKDERTQIGAVIVNSDKRILATGYNGFPKGIDDAEEKYDNRELKYELIVHAEMNAIYNATFNGISLKDSTLYVWGLPVCSECAKGIIQVGINRVVMSASDVPQRWIDSFEKTQALFEEAEVDWTFS